MPLGISPTLVVFQQKLNQGLEGLSGIRIVTDNIIVVGGRNIKEESGS